MNKRKIMVIHNEKIVGDMAKFSLEREGYSVAVFLRAEPALARLLAEKYDVLITDFKMSGVEGSELLTAVRNTSPATKIIMISSYANLDTAFDAARLNVHDVFEMPVRLKDLKASIKRALQIPELEVATLS